MNKIEAARHAQGLIQLEADTADAIKQVIESVSQINKIEDGQVEFEGHRIIEGHGFALQVNCFDIFQCPRGYLLHTYMDTGPNWAVSGPTLKDVLNKAPDQRVAKRAHGLLIQKNLIPFGH